MEGTEIMTRRFGYFGVRAYMHALPQLTLLL